MKLIILILATIVFSINNVNSQSKREIEQQNQALKRIIVLDEIKMDSLEKVNMLNLHFINYFVEKYVPASPDLTLSQAQKYLDSLMSNSLASGKEQVLTDSIVKLQDSLRAMALYTDSIMEVDATIKTILGMKLEQTNYPQSPNDFFGVWSLVIDPLRMIMDSLYTGIAAQNRMILPKNVERGMIKKINFIDTDFAELVFMNGTTEKCFFDIDNFSKDQPYTIHFNGKDDINLYLLVQHLPEGIQVSYQDKDYNTDNLFYFGYMKPE